ncbi:L-histidine N(alpha)-methyltransferase [Tropicimonas sp. S265A]|uniref:L-histidine N(alpha)-methyltransferase n=1 Tax=Tropicimonas sp. S265A TaxID=3415134 RepID=UPI003C7D9567
MGVSMNLTSATAPRALVRDALAGLRAPRKSLNPKWLYDPAGSALFEQITSLPEYYLTRTEVGILRQHATALAGLVPEGGALVEFGSGASVKTRILLDAGPHMAAYVPIDISADFLHATADALRDRYPALSVQPVVGDFAADVALPDTIDALPKVGFFPGSTIGNITAHEAIALLSRARAWPGIKAFVLGVDLVKDPAMLVPAYDDAAGVTARFIGNILVRLNAEAGANFDLSAFAYEAMWNAAAARIEMSLVARAAQTVSLSGVAIDFVAGERISVSMSRKYTAQSLSELGKASGWRVAQMLSDPEDLFSIAVLEPAD